MGGRGEHGGDSVGYANASVNGLGERGIEDDLVEIAG
jgi:hypothetical protein